MIHRIWFLVLCLLCCLSNRAATEPWSADDIQMVHLQDEHRYVCNPEGILSQAAVDSMDAVLYKLEKTKGVQSVVVVVSRVKNADCYQFGIDLGRKHGVGSKSQQTGLVIVLSTKDRDYYILTGYGLEGSLPDAICKRIENKVMMPYLKQGDWDNAILSGIKAISAYVEGDETLRKELSQEENDDEDIGLVLLAFLTIAIMIFIIAVVIQRPETCPHCGQKKYRKHSEKYLYTEQGWDYYQVQMKCDSCGWSSTTIKRRIHDDNDDGGAFIVGSALGSIMGRGGFSGGGGGFHGGHFGGGGFGGGGAGGHF